MIFRREHPKSIGNRLIDIGCRVARCLFVYDVFDRQGKPKKRFYRQARRYRLPWLTRAAFRVRNTRDADTYLLESGREGLTILYLHGGAYWTQPSFFHFRFLRKLVTEAGGRVIFPVYPKAPAYHCADVYRFIEPIYARAVRKHGAENVVLMGDSAGGGFALAFAMLLGRRGEPVPRVAAISPWMDVTCTNERMAQAHDAWLDVNALQKQGRVFAGDMDPRDPRVSPLFGDASLLHDALIFTGTSDVLSPDALLFEEKNPNITIWVYKDRNHVFPLFPIGDGREHARAQIVKWLLRQGRPKRPERASKPLRKGGKAGRPMLELHLSSPAFAEGGWIPLENTARGRDLSPELRLENLSPDAVTLAVTMDDRSHPLFPDYNHWVAWNLPVNPCIPVALPKGETAASGMKQGVGYGKHVYKGPKPPFRAIHSYRFTVYALDCALSLPTDSRRDALLAAMTGHILQKATLTGKFQSRRRGADT